ncbi:MAG: LSm family protein [Candidatus Diapherotrites archaeon]|nr:LSm family protein [Candidatus Diapherotrites archaeon]
MQDKKTEIPGRPFDDLNKAVGETVLVKLKGEKTVRGILKAFDVHLNIVLDQAEELENGEVKIKHSKLMVRGDSIIMIAL